MGSQIVKVFALSLFIFLITASSLYGQIEDFAAIDFKKADSIALLYPDYSLLDIKGLAEKLARPLPTEVEKFRAIYRWICNNIDNDYKLFQQNKHKRETLKDPEALRKWNKRLHPMMLETLVKKKRTVCTGYSYLVRELALYGGLSCVMIDGYGRTVQANNGGSGIPNHSWNAVQINNKWYLCDATWSSGAIDMEMKSFVKKYNDFYFLTDPSLFIRNHYPLDTSWILLNNKPTLQDFLNRPLNRK